MTFRLTGLETSEEIQSRRQSDAGVSFLLDRSALLEVLERFVMGDVPAVELERWADTVEAMDDVDYEAGHEDIIAEVLFQLGAPEINRALDDHGIRHLITKLKA